MNLFDNLYSDIINIILSYLDYDDIIRLTELFKEFINYNELFYNRYKRHMFKNFCTYNSKELYLTFLKWETTSLSSDYISLMFDIEYKTEENKNKYQSNRIDKIFIYCKGNNIHWYHENIEHVCNYLIENDIITPTENYIKQLHKFRFGV